MLCVGGAGVENIYPCDFSADLFTRQLFKECCALHSLIQYLDQRYEKQFDVRESEVSNLTSAIC